MFAVDSIICDLSNGMIMLNGLNRSSYI